MARKGRILEPIEPSSPSKGRTACQGVQPTAGSTPPEQCEPTSGGGTLGGPILTPSWQDTPCRCRWRCPWCRRSMLKSKRSCTGVPGLPEQSATNEVAYNNRDDSLIVPEAKLLESGLGRASSPWNARSLPALVAPASLACTYTCLYPGALCWCLCVCVCPLSHKDTSLGWAQPTQVQQDLLVTLGHLERLHFQRKCLELGHTFWGNTSQPVTKISLTHAC